MRGLRFFLDARKHRNPVSFPLIRFAACSASSIFWGRIFIVLCFISFVKCSAVPASFRHPSRSISAPIPHPRGSGQRSWTAGLAKPDRRGKNAEADGGKLAFIRAVQAFPCHGGRWAAGGQGHSQFNSIDFHAKPVLWCFLDSRKYRPSSSPSFSPPVPHTKQQPHASSLRHAAVFLQKTLS